MLADRRLPLLLASGILALALGLAAAASAETEAGETPLPPRDVHAEDADGEDVRLAWKPPLAGEADTYHVYRLDGQTWTQIATTVNTNATVAIGEHDVTAFHLTAANEAGESGPSEPVVAVEEGSACQEASVSVTMEANGCSGEMVPDGISAGACIRISPDQVPPVGVDLNACRSLVPGSITVRIAVRA
jgi:hypothetical protein